MIMTKQLETFIKVSKIITRKEKELLLVAIKGKVILEYQVTCCKK